MKMSKYSIVVFLLIFSVFLTSCGAQTLDADNVDETKGQSTLEFVTPETTSDVPQPEPTPIETISLPTQRIEFGHSLLLSNG